MAKKTIGFYSPAATQKALKAGSCIAVQTVEGDDDRNIYVTNGYLAFRMFPAEYDACVRPLVLRAPGTFTVTLSTNDTKESAIDIAAIFAREAKEDAPILTSTDLRIQSRKSSATSAVYVSDTFGIALNADFPGATPGLDLRATSPLSPAFAWFGNEPVALYLPMNIKSANLLAAANAISGKDAAPNTQELEAKLEAAQESAARERADLRAQLQAKEEELQALRAQLAEAQAATQEAPKEADPAPDFQAIAARWSSVPGLTVTVKGAQTASPVLWVSGAVEAHAEELKAAGARWSAKRSAYYYRAA